MSSLRGKMSNFVHRCIVLLLFLGKLENLKIISSTLKKRTDKQKLQQPSLVLDGFREHGKLFFFSNEILISEGICMETVSSLRNFLSVCLIICWATWTRLSATSVYSLYLEAAGGYTDITKWRAVQQFLSWVLSLPETSPGSFWILLAWVCCRSGAARLHLDPNLCLCLHS